MKSQCPQKLITSYLTKVGNSFPIPQFFPHGSSTPYKFVKNSEVGGILFYIWGDMLFETKSKIDIEVISVETILGKSKCL